MELCPQTILASTDNKERIENKKIGDKRSFGNYNWIVLDVQSKRTLIMFLLSMEEIVCQYFGDSSDIIYVSVLYDKQDLKRKEH